MRDVESDARGKEDRLLSMSFDGIIDGFGSPGPFEKCHQNSSATHLLPTSATARPVTEHRSAREISEDVLIPKSYATTA